LKIIVGNWPVDWYVMEEPRGDIVRMVMEIDTTALLMERYKMVGDTVVRHPQTGFPQLETVALSSARVDYQRKIIFVRIKHDPNAVRDAQLRRAIGAV
jgi:hypothetical protein